MENAPKRSKEPEYTTRATEGPRADGTWTAELSKDGVPYLEVEVGSISALFAQSK